MYLRDTFKTKVSYKIKALYNVFNTINSPYNHIYSIIRKCLYFVDFTTFQILGQKFVKFFRYFFLENLRRQKGHSEIS